MTKLLYPRDCQVPKDSQNPREPGTVESGFGVFTHNNQVVQGSGNAWFTSGW